MHSIKDGKSMSDTTS